MGLGSGGNIIPIRGQLATIISRPDRVIELVQDASFPKLSNFVLHKQSSYLQQFAMYNTDIKVNDGHKLTIPP